LRSVYQLEYGLKLGLRARLPWFKPAHTSLQSRQHHTQGFIIGSTDRAYVMCRTVTGAGFHRIKTYRNTVQSQNRVLYKYFRPLFS